MAQARGTFYLQRVTLKRLQHFSKRSGMPQSTLVDQIISVGLQHLEKNWTPVSTSLDSAFSNKPSSLIDRAPAPAPALENHAELDASIPAKKGKRI